MSRAKQTNTELDPDLLVAELRIGLNRAKGDSPQVKLVFKDVTYEQTKSENFRDKVDKALPKHKLKQLGRWAEHFEAAKASQESKN